MELPDGISSKPDISSDSSVFTINMVLCVKNFLMVFDQIMALTKGGPAQSTESISYLIYQMVWQEDSSDFRVPMRLFSSL